MKTTLLLLALTLTLTTSFAKADGRQVCVDSKDAVYSVKVTGFAQPGTKWSAILENAGSLAAGTDLSKITFKENLADTTTPSIMDLAYTLKNLVAPSRESQEDVGGVYVDEPRVYEANGVDLVCSSTMSEDEFRVLQK